MRAPLVQKFAFSIRTRSGVQMDNVSIPGRDQTDAQRKLGQIYPGCTILSGQRLTPPAANEAPPSFEQIIDIIAR